jgi:hypothetical protein
MAVMASLGVASAQESTTPSNSSSDLTLRASGVGEDSYAVWKRKKGLPDAQGKYKQALYFHYKPQTSAPTAGVALIKGLNGERANILTNLSWEHRDDGYCDSGSPRWSIGLSDHSDNYTVDLGCAGATHTPDENNSHWVRDSYTGSDIQTQIEEQTGQKLVDLKIHSLAIVFDGGTDKSDDFVYLDNIEVNDKQWTSASDDQ